MHADDIEHLIALSRPAVHPDGSWAVVASSRPDLAANRSVGQLWRVNLDDPNLDDPNLDDADETEPTEPGPEVPNPRATRLTQGVADANPQFSRDGALLAFVRADAKGKSQVFVLDPAGGEPVQATDAAQGVEQYELSPDATRIAFTSRVPEHGRYGTVEGLGARDESPRLIDEPSYLGNGLGWTRDRRTHLFVAEVPDPHGEPRYDRAPRPSDGLDPDEKLPATPALPAAVRLSRGDFSHTSPAWTADGTRVVVLSARHTTRERDLLTQVFEFDADPETLVKVGALAEAEALAADATTDGARTLVDVDAGLSINRVITTPDGRLALLASDMGPDGRDFVARNTGLYLVDQPGTPGAPPRRLTDPETIDLGEVGSHLTWTREGILVHVRSRGRVQLARVNETGPAVGLADLELLTSGDIEVTGHGVGGRGGGGRGDGVGGERVVVVAGGLGSFAEVALAENGRLRTLTNFGAGLAGAGLVTPTEHEFTTRDGQQVHGWVWQPEGPGPHPVLLNIHGGPFAHYGVRVFDEAQVAVAAGYAVVQCNPRGSAGYGQQHGRAIRHAMGTVDLADVLDFLDGSLTAHPALDPDRVGIMGGSYGGYLTAWTIAHDHRFAAAIVERGYLDPETFVGTSDIGWFFSDEYTGADPAQRKAQSPMAVVDQVTTPTLVVHSEEDYRCPLEQAQRYFAALKRRGVETQLLVFPGENHELTRGGSPRHRVERFEHVMGWWARRLPVTAAGD